MVKAAKTPPSTAANKKNPTHKLSKSEDKHQIHNSKTSNSIIPDSSIRRSTRSKPILDGLWSALENTDDEEEEDDDEDEREMKKQKLVQRLKSEPVSVRNSQSNDLKADEMMLMSRIAEGSGSEAKDRRGTVSSAADADIRVLEEGLGPTTPMPAKKTILFILDRLQKKDTQGVFSEPVDPEELPDYHEIIENPMDFSTVRQKLGDGLYRTLEEFEDDIFLICSNAMLYNSPSTVYFRKARTIQELAKRDFENLRQTSEDGKPQPKVIRRGRPPKVIEKSPEKDGSHVPNSESPSTAVLCSISENYKNYNLRKGLSPMKYVTEGILSIGNDDASCTDTISGMREWNTEFPASILRAPYGKKPVVVDETRRETYKQPFTNAKCAINMLMTEPKRLLPVGLGMTEHVYASSLARFAAGLGPLAWQIALKKIKQSLAPNVEFDPLQFAYKSPKFPAYEVDANLTPVIPTTWNKSSTKTPIINTEEASMETAGMPISQTSLNHVNVGH